jgi:hypothetical protein
VKYFKAAAGQANAISQFNYGICCYRGEGICIDFVEAFEHFKQSSNQNHPPAQLAVGFCLHYNRGIPRDKDFARRYFSLAVESGMVVNNEWDRIRRIENPIEELSLSTPLFDCHKISLSLATREQSYLGRVDPWSVMESDESRRKKRRKRSRIDLTNRADSPINLNALCEIEKLGSAAC